MRVQHFVEWTDTSSHDFRGRDTKRDWRLAFNLFRTDQLLPAFGYIRKRGLGAIAHHLEHRYGQLRHQAEAQHSAALVQFVDDLNRELDTIALADANRASFIGVPLPTIRHADLPSYDTPIGRMTPEAVRRTGGPNDVKAIRQVLEGNLQGERGAPMGGFRHFHVAGLASNVMSIEAPADDDRQPDDIIAFTGHMDNSGPGKANSARAVEARKDAVENGWVWVAIVGDNLNRLVHP